MVVVVVLEVVRASKRIVYQKIVRRPFGMSNYMVLLLV